MAMGVYRISELAERSGFPPSTLRFYEQAGLVAAGERTAAGYRLYDEAALERLRFIARAKQLGLPLEEIRDLLTVWEQGSCGSVQNRLRPLLDDKIAQVEERIAELTAFCAQLVQARADLGAYTTDGPCDESCGCLTPPGHAHATSPVTFGETAARPLLPTTSGCCSPSEARS